MFAAADIGASAPDAAWQAGFMPARRPLRVGVLVDLVLSPQAGGHVKCWQRFAEAAVDFPDRLDLTVHFNGPEPRRIELSPSVRYQLLPPVFSTARLIRQLPDHTDLAPWHPRLVRHLTDYDVIHTTDAFFCYARTATRFGRRHHTPVVTSIHTNTPEYARITTAKLIEGAFGQRFGRYVDDTFALSNAVSKMLSRRLTRHLDTVTSALAGYAEVSEASSEGPFSGVSLRRGLDRGLFSPNRRDRDWFRGRFGLPRDQMIAMYAGKLNAGKNVPFLAPIIRRARQAGVPVHLFCAGAGAQQADLQAALGMALTCPGPLGQEELARAYASADLFLFPSTIDESGNAALEAMASGLPSLLAAGSGVAARMADCRGVRVLPGNQPEPWVDALLQLASAPALRERMGQATRDFIEAEVPSWADVLLEDLLPVWEEAASRAMV
jgi:glycosyltransferase involved in cell wall biosynthesis